MGLGNLAGKQAMIGRCPARNHRIAGAGKQPSMRGKPAERSAIPASNEAAAESVT